MRILVLMIGFLLPLGVANAKAPGAVRERKACIPTATLVEGKQAPTVRTLNQTPNASQFRTLYRVIDKCSEPVVLRRGIGIHKR
jgi:hypothetical protein